MQARKRSAAQADLPGAAAVATAGKRLGSVVAATADADGLPRVCVCASGSVAAVKLPEVVQLLVDRGLYVDVVVSSAGDRFQAVSYQGSSPVGRLQRLLAMRDESGTPRVTVWRDEDEWGDYTDVGSSRVLHIDLAKRNQALLVAPLSANTLAAVALGMCGNLLCSVVRAWYYDMDEEFAAPICAKYGGHVLSRPLYARHPFPSLLRSSALRTFR